jgi:TonB family protein
MTSRTVIFVSLFLRSAFSAEWFAISIEAPLYPVVANSAQIEGTVRLKVSLDRAGRVSRAETLAGASVLTTAALENIRHWRFSACEGTRTGKPTIEFTYVFRLEGEVQARPRTRFRYEQPYTVIVTSERVHWMPSAER